MQNSKATKTTFFYCKFFKYTFMRHFIPSLTVCGNMKLIIHYLSTKMWKWFIVNGLIKNNTANLPIIQQLRVYHIGLYKFKLMPPNKNILNCLTTSAGTLMKADDQLFLVCVYLLYCFYVVTHGNGFLWRLQYTLLYMK